MCRSGLTARLYQMCEGYHATINVQGLTGHTGVYGLMGHTIGVRVNRQH